MNYDTATELYRQLPQLPNESPLLLDLREDLVARAVRYARLRTDWELADMEGRQNIDETRRLAHNAFIDACNILARAMAKAELDTSWRRQLGEDRRTIGDFACFVHCILGLEAR